MELLCISKSKLKKSRLYHILSNPVILGRCDDLLSFIWRSISETGHICKTAAYLKTVPTLQASPRLVLQLSNSAILTQTSGRKFGPAV